MCFFGNSYNLGRFIASYAEFNVKDFWDFLNCISYFTFLSFCFCNTHVLLPYISVGDADGIALCIQTCNYSVISWSHQCILGTVNSVIGSNTPVRLFFISFNCKNRLWFFFERRLSLRGKFSLACHFVSLLGDSYLNANWINKLTWRNLFNTCDVPFPSRTQAEWSL